MSAKKPLGIFWDIENCAIPRTKCTSSVVKHLRDFVADRHPECGYAKEFCCACDVYNLNKLVVESLDKNGVNVVHVNSTAKNAAEDKIQELIDMYVDKYGNNGSALLCIISSDINLAKQIRNARRRDLDVMLIHGSNCSNDLKNSVNESYDFFDILKNADNYTRDESQQKPGVLEISNLPMHKHYEQIKFRLSQLCENCGGKPQYINEGKTLIRFPSKDDALRCLNRINGKDVFGNRIHARLFGEESASKPLTKIMSQSQQNVSQSTGQSGEVSRIELKSVIKGLFTERNDNYLEVVRDLIRSWNDSYVRPDFISDVQRSLKYGKGDGKHTLFVIAVEPKACRALVNAAQKYLKPSEGIKWNQYLSYSDYTKRTHNKSAQNHSMSYAKPKKSFPRRNDSSVTSVIIGLNTSRGEDVTKTVRNIVKGWNDPKIKEEFVKLVERDRKYYDKDGDVLLFVTAVSPEANKSLIDSANKYWQPRNGIKWNAYQFRGKLRKDDDLESNASDIDTSLNQFSSVQDLSVGSSLQNLKDSQELSDEHKSVIIGLETEKDQNLTKLVRQIVNEWNDKEVKPYFIVKVERFPGFPDVDGRTPLLVKAISPQKSTALITSAEKYWNISHSPVWAHFNTGQKIAELYQKSTETTQVDSPIPRKIYENISSVSKTNLTLFPEPIPRKKKNITEIKENILKDIIIDKKRDSKDKGFVQSIVNEFGKYFNTSKSSLKSESTEYNLREKAIVIRPETNLISSPVIPMNHNIKDRIRVGLMICFSGRLKAGADTFIVELTPNSSDVAFHLQIQVRHSKIVRNSCVGGKWGIAETSAPNFPFTIGEAFDIIIGIESTQYVIKINGEKICEFKHRINVESITGLFIAGDVTIFWLRYSGIYG